MISRNIILNLTQNVKNYFFCEENGLVKMAAAQGFSLPGLFDTLCREARIEAA